FILAVMAGGRIVNKLDNKYDVLLIEGSVLLAGGVMALALLYLPAIDDKTGMYLVVMLCVTAMGLQNAFGKLFAKKTLGPTTMMTGNVTQAALDLGRILPGGGSREINSLESLQKQML